MSIRIASSTLHTCVGTDRKTDPARILAVLNALSADVIALRKAATRLLEVSITPAGIEAEAAE